VKDALTWAGTPVRRVSEVADRSEADASNGRQTVEKSL
jgi:hypothetical protein